MPGTYEAKLNALKHTLADYEKLAVAFSGGVDSTFLLAVAREVCGDNACALTATSPAFPTHEHNEALGFCTQRNIRHILFDAKHFDIEGFVENDPKRCYYCKKSLFTRMKTIANEQNLGMVVDGSNTDDINDYRPGRKALEELGIASPLLACGFSKQDIRDASTDMGLQSATKPSFACLATRFPYGQCITPEGLTRVDAAEASLRKSGFTTLRVRSLGDEARIEVPATDFEAVLAQREGILASLQDLGFTYVALNLEPYYTGSMNKELGQK